MNLRFSEDEIFELAVSRTLHFEGGYVLDPDDPGGDTKYGISRRAHPSLNIKELSREQAKAIYRRDYWSAPGIYRIEHPSLAAMVFDLGVMCGPSDPITWLQKAANRFSIGLVEDGVCGSKTAAAINAMAHPAALTALVRHFATAHFIAQYSPRFLAGWLNRLESRIFIIKDAGVVEAGYPITLTGDVI